MEDEVLRLQEEWATVLREIQRASEENLILKDILMLSMSFPTCAQDESRTSTSAAPTDQMQHVEAPNMSPKDQYRPTFDHFELSTSLGTNMTNTSPHAVASLPMGCAGSEMPEAFDFSPAPSTLHEGSDGDVLVQRRFAEEMDETAFSSFTAVSHTEFGPSANASGVSFSAEEPSFGKSHHVVHPQGPPAYYDNPGIAPQVAEPIHTLSVTSSSNFHLGRPHLFKPETGLAQRTYATTSLHKRQ
jgi:hypothetical protein